MITFQDVSSYILFLASKQGIHVSNLKLQKLMYYSQGFCLGLTKKPLFEAEIKAWDHGPVVEPLYYQYKIYGKSALPTPLQFDDSVFDAIQKEIISSVFNTLGKKSAWELREMTHRETTWLAHSVNDDKGDSSEITKQEMTEYFSAQLSIDDYFKSFQESTSALNKGAVKIPDDINTSEQFIAWVRGSAH